MSDHYHYASDIHDVAERYHRHYDEENAIDGLRSGLRHAEQLIGGLREDLGRAEERIRELEAGTAWGKPCLCGEGAAGDCSEGPEPEEYDPGPEVDDEGGMSEYRYAVLPAEEDR